MIEATLSLHRLFQAIQVQWAFVDTWKSVERVSILFVKFRKLIEVIVADAIAAFYGVQLLATSSEVEALWIMISLLIAFISWKSQHTSVSIASVGFQLSGGIILQMPYLLPSGLILRMYSIGSRNSSSVGRNVGASVRPNRRSVFGRSLV